MRIFLAVMLLLPSAVLAATPEETYLAARDKAIATFKQKAAANAVTDAVTAQGTRIGKELEKQLRRIVGRPPKGFPGPGKMSPDTLFSEDVGFGALDGLSFTTRNEQGSVLVTTTALLQPWLQAHKTWWKDQQNPPPDAAKAFLSESFYTQAISADAAVSIYAPVPIDKPAGAEVATALLVIEQQDYSSAPPNEIIVSLISGNRVFVATATVAPKIAPIPACETVAAGFKAKADAALAAYNASGLKDQASFDASTRLELEGNVAFRRCYAEHARTERFYPALIRQAQALADTLAAR